MNFAVKTCLGILLLIVLIQANEQCQSLRCNSTTEICRLKPNCTNDELINSNKCFYCALKANLTHTDESSYDDYYEYDEDETSDKINFDDDSQYDLDYIDPVETTVNRKPTIRKLGTCPKIVQAIGDCSDQTKIRQPDCRFDNDCPGDLKCCEAACGKRVCTVAIKSAISMCPTSFECSLNCRLGYQTDSNGCLKCDCQSCPSMDHCQKTCQSGYLKDLFGCDICECNDQCPPFNCQLQCPPGVGFIQSENGCPLCQCAVSKFLPIASTSSCQKDVHCPPGFRCLNDVHNVPMCQAVPAYSANCPENFRQTCDLQCPNGNYLLDDKGCPTCACERTCPEIKCRANCGDAGYVLDENGCQTCACAKKEQVQCSKVMCRMFCEHGFKRDKNGCEYCACNNSPQPCPPLSCDNSCPNGYRKDYSGCPTCECIDVPKQQDVQCEEIVCDVACKYGYQRDERGCQQCACNTCPMTRCRMFCMYGFRRNEDGCEVCECDWSPVVENIQCDDRVPCEGARVCNSELKLCEIVSPDRVNWFLYDFEVDEGLFEDEKFVQIFKKSLIQKIATKYALSPSQITVSSIEQKGLTSFQIMPFFHENMEAFDQKMDKIDADLNSHEFRSVLPAVVDVIDNDKTPSRPPRYQWCSKIRSFVRSRPMFFATVAVLSIFGLIFLIAYFRSSRRHWQLVSRSESKLPIYEASYSVTPGEDDHDYPAKHIIVESDDLHLSNDKRALV